MRRRALQPVQPPSLSLPTLLLLDLPQDPGQEAVHHLQSGIAVPQQHLIHQQGQQQRNRHAMNAQVASLATDGGLSEHELLRQTLGARVYDVARETALEPAPLLSARLGQAVLLKREDQQPVFSFKLRGAYNRMAQLSDAERARGVIAASAGNHAQGVALAAARLGIRAVIVMPVTAPQVKVDAVRRFGGVNVEVVLAGDSYSDAQAAAARWQAEHGYAFVHPFDDAAVIAGQATVGMEILRLCARLAVFHGWRGGGSVCGSCGRRRYRMAFGGVGVSGGQRGR